MSAVPKPVSDRTILEVSDLHVEFDTYGGIVKAVRGVELQRARRRNARDRRRVRLRQIRDGAEHHGIDPHAAGPHHAGHGACLHGVDIMRQKIVNGARTSAAAASA